MAISKMKKVCFVATADWQVKMFLLEHIKTLSNKFEITVVMNAPNMTSLKSLGLDVPVRAVHIERPISILLDFKALLELFYLFRTCRFDIVHSIAPKSGLLSMCAAFFAGVQIRVHIYTGQIWATKSGVMRWLLRMMDRITAFFATNILTDSHSQMVFLINENVVSREKISVLAKGSVCGVDTMRFIANNRKRASVRNSLSLKESDIVFLFLGRLNIEKGVLDLANAFSRVCVSFSSSHLIFVGPDEGNMQQKIKDICITNRCKVHFIGFTEYPEDYIAAADVLCLPSYREGFGQVIIEAAAAGIPALGSRIYGITDAIEEGKTGLLFEAGNVNDLTDKMIQFLKYPTLRKEMGGRARERVSRDFSKDILIQAMLNYYELKLIDPEKLK